MREIEKFNTKKEAKRFEQIGCKIAIAIEETGCTYEEALRAMEAIRCNYEKKGRDLLNNTNIQEVAKYGGILE